MAGPIGAMPAVQSKNSKFFLKDLNLFVSNVKCLYIHDFVFKFCNLKSVFIS